MHTVAMDSSLDPVGLLAAVSCAPPLLRRCNHNISPGAGFPSVKRGNPHPPQERSNSSGSTGKDGRRVLQPLLPPPEKDRGIATYLGFETNELTSQTAQVQNAYGATPTVFLVSPRLANISGSNRCIFSCHDSPRAQKISEVCIRGNRIRIPSPAIWVVEIRGSSAGTVTASGHKSAHSTKGYGDIQRNPCGRYLCSGQLGIATHVHFYRLDVTAVTVAWSVLTAGVSGHGPPLS